MSDALADTRNMNISTLGPSSAPISAMAIGAELEMAVLKKLKSNAEQQGAALVELINQSRSYSGGGLTATRRLRLRSGTTRSKLIPCLHAVWRSPLDCHLF